MLWDVLMEALFPNRVMQSMEVDEIARVVVRLQEEITQQNLTTINKITDQQEHFEETININQEIQHHEQREEKVKFANLPRLSSDTDLYLSSRSTSCCGLTPNIMGRTTIIDFLTSPERSSHSLTNSNQQTQCHTTHLISFNHTEGAIQEDVECSRIITEEDLMNQDISEKSDKSNSFVQTESEKSFKITPVAKEPELILIDYLFEYAENKLEEKDTSLTSIDLASHYMNTRQNMMHKEDIIRLLMKEYANQKSQNDFVKRQFEINSQVLNIIPESDTIKILLYQLRLVQAITLIYGHSIDQDLIKLISLFCLIDDKSIKKILEPFAIKGYISFKKSMHYKHLSKIIDKSATKSVLFATATHLIQSLNNNTRKSVQLFSSFMSNGKFNDPKITCQHAEIGFENLSIDLDSSD